VSREVITRNLSERPVTHHSNGNSQNTETTDRTEPTRISNERFSAYLCWFRVIGAIRVLAVAVAVAVALAVAVAVAVCAYSAVMRRTATLPVDRFVPTDRVS
jgi:hypothetical protein